MLDPDVLLLLTLAAFVAGFIDSIAGGGGLIALPALLWAGLPPLQALATNKLQGSFGTLTASLNFLHKGRIGLRALRWPILLTFTGSLLGSLSVTLLPGGVLERLVPILLILFAIYFLLSPRASDIETRARIGMGWFALTAGVLIGFYDGFFGPGTGSFFVVAFLALGGFGLTRATAATKVLNFTSNIASLLFFASQGLVLWQVGLLMGAAQMAGAWLGSHLALRHGARLIRPLLVTVSLAVSLKLLLSD